MNDLEAMDRAATSMAACLRLLQSDRLDEPSACEEWTIYQLVNHIIGGAHRYLMLLRGATADEVAATRQQDHVGADPVASFWRWQSPLAAEFTAPGARERLVHHRAGDRSGTTLLGMRVLELTLHGWDISHSVGLEESLDAALAEHLLDRQAALIEELRARGVCRRIRPAVSAAADAPTLLLHRTGRG